MTKTRIIAAIGVSCAALFAAGAHAQTMRKNEFYFSTPLLIQPFHFTLTARADYAATLAHVGADRDPEYIARPRGRRS